MFLSNRYEQPGWASTGFATSVTNTHADTRARCVLPSGTVVRVWLFNLREGLNLVRSLKLQLFCTLAGLPLISSAPPTTSLPGEQRWRSLMDACRLFMLCPRGLAIRTRSLKLSFWLQRWKMGMWKEERRVTQERGTGCRGNGGDGPVKERGGKGERCWKRVLDGFDSVRKIDWATEREREGGKKHTVNAYSPFEGEMSSESRHRDTFCLSLQLKHPPTDMPRTPEQSPWPPETHHLGLSSSAFHYICSKGETSPPTTRQFPLFMPCRD